MFAHLFNHVTVAVLEPTPTAPAVCPATGPVAVPAGARSHLVGDGQRLGVRLAPGMLRVWISEIGQPTGGLLAIDLTETHLEELTDTAVAVTGHGLVDGDDARVRVTLSRHDNDR